jgi:predicted transcriptional regulator
MDSYKCEICREILVESTCSYQKFTNGDKFPICNWCIEQMIKNGELIEYNNKFYQGEYEFTKKGLEERLKKSKKN